MSTKELIEKSVLDWLERQLASRDISVSEVDAEFDLNEFGLLDSFAVVDLFVSVSEATGTELDLDSVHLDDCLTISQLMETVNAAFARHQNA